MSETKTAGWTKLREIREAANISRESLGEAAGLSGTQIYRLETGRSPRGGLSLGKLQALADALNVSVSTLLADDSPDQRFVTRLMRIPDRERALLAREAGKPMSDAQTPRAYMVFYKTLPEDAPVEGPDDPQTDTWYQAGCIIADGMQRMQRWDAEPHSALSLPAAIGQLAAATGATYYKQRLAHTLDTRWDADGYAAQLVHKLVRVALQEGYPIDWMRLMHDILRWNDPDQPVPYEWVNAYLKEQPEEDFEIKNPH